MKTRHTVTLVALVVAASSALASPPPADNAPLTRAQVREAFVAARNAGDLVPAGDAADYLPPRTTGRSTLTRGQVRGQVLEARASGQLTPAGEGDEAFLSHAAPATYSGLTRDAVRLATINARQAGELTPAGDFDDASLARERTQERYALAALQSRRIASVAVAGR